VKVAAARVLSTAGVPRAVGAARRREAGGARVLVLSYHRVAPDFAESAKEGLASLLVSARTLRRQLEQVGRKYDLVSLDEAVRVLREPRGAPGRDVAAVTFDDGYADNHHAALPVLSLLRVPATVFVATGYVGTERRMPHDRIFAALTELARRRIPFRRAALEPALQALLDACARPEPAGTLERLIAMLPHARLLHVADALEARAGLTEQDLPPGSRLLGWEEIRALESAGVAIGGHSVSHAVLPNLSLADARREIAGCRDAIAERLGRRPRHFAYPNGYHSAAVRRAVAEAGFETALTTEDRENSRGADLHRIRRKALWENSTLGPLGYSASLAACNFAGVFHSLGLARAVDGERHGVADGRHGGTSDDDEAREQAAS
jgi:peptidoglycan/xylan/chitin deacetylase (PgdA/CDA1 family)